MIVHFCLPFHLSTFLPFLAFSFPMFFLSPTLLRACYCSPARQCIDLYQSTYWVVYEGRPVALHAMPWPGSKERGRMQGILVNGRNGLKWKALFVTSFLGILQSAAFGGHYSVFAGLQVCRFKSAAAIMHNLHHTLQPIAEHVLWCIAGPLVATRHHLYKLHSGLLHLSLVIFLPILPAADAVITCRPIK